MPDKGGGLLRVAVISSDGRWEVEVWESGEATGTLNKCF